MIMSDHQNIPPKHPVIDAFMGALPSALISILGVTVSISFFMGSAKTDLNTVAATQNVMGQQISTLVDRFSTVDKNQAVMANQIQNMAQEITRLNQGWANLNEDMKCIRMVAASNGGDITKC